MSDEAKAPVSDRQSASTEQLPTSNEQTAVKSPIPSATGHAELGETDDAAVGNVSVERELAEGDNPKAAPEPTCIQVADQKGQTSHSDDGQPEESSDSSQQLDQTADPVSGLSGQLQVGGGLDLAAAQPGQVAGQHAGSPSDEHSAVPLQRTTHEQSGPTLRQDDQMEQVIPAVQSTRSTSRPCYLDLKQGMGVHYRIAIRRERESLVADLQYDLPALLDHLVSQDVITREQYDTVRARDTKWNQAREAVDLLMKENDLLIDVFLQFLKTSNEELHDKLTKTAYAVEEEGIHHSDETRFEPHRSADFVTSPGVPRASTSPIELDQLNPGQLLASASAGQALRGIFVGGQDENATKRILLTPPTDVKLMKPVMQQVNDDVEFLSEMQSDRFHRLFDTMGYSFTKSSRGGLLDLGTEAGFANRCDSENDGSQFPFYSRVKYTVVPTAACQLNPCSLKFSPDALQELQSIESLLKRTGDTKSVTEKCKAFFNRYGSHVNGGVLHFGGTSKVVATFCGSTGNVNERTKAMVRMSLDDYVAATPSTVSDDKTLDSFEVSRINLHEKRLGGPQNSSSLDIWKDGLVSSCETWALIDRGQTIGEDIVGIWEMVSDHKNDFDDPQTLSQTLFTEWRLATRDSHHDELPQNETQGACTDLLNRLGLTKYHPSGIALSQVVTIRKSGQNTGLLALPWKIIGKLFMVDYRSRDYPVSEVNEILNADGEKKPSACGHTSVMDDVFGEDVCSDEHLLNPLDVLLVTFGCCDSILRQVIAEKLFTCKLAIPFMYPHGSPDNVVMSLWALRTIILERCDKKTREARETRVIDNPIPILTFVRLGRPSLSKSKLMNDVLSDTAHNTFFNDNCKNGGVERQVANGLVESSWFLPRGEKNDTFPAPALLLNLRGDAASTSLQKQMAVLNKISSVVLVTADVEELGTTTYIEALTRICHDANRVIILLTSRSRNPPKQLFQSSLRKCTSALGDKIMEDTVWISGLSKGVLKNASDLKIEVCQALSKELEDHRGMSLEKAAHIARSEFVMIDEDDPCCRQGKDLASVVMNYTQKKTISECKTDFLPLQGKPWINYSKLLKEQHRLSGVTQFSSSHEVERLTIQITAVRNRQLEIFNCGMPFIQEFISVLKQCVHNEDVATHFLQWMKMMLEDKSRNDIPDLRRNYNAAWASFQENEDTSKIEHLRKGVDHAEQRLVDASFGLEHLFREIGQIYEAIKGSNIDMEDETRMLADHIPQIAAKFLGNGYPLELIDGDASCIPIAWTKAVLSKLADVIGQGKKLFVLSVLGIQSSGKSTLLNTMFGLQFSVSAGRCTKGAFMQLIPVDELAELPFDYVLVIDTEGLRAEELGNQTHTHDNELATLVIGLGDVTIMNIKGENYAEIKDILQIAVQAFLRMKRVNTYMDRACVFIHQNVPALDAKEKMRHACQKLQENLDTMTKEAADGEKLKHIQRFSQIRKFDVNEHVWHLPDLWHGDPPMAPANSGYSEKVDRVRSKLIEGIANDQLTFQTTPDFAMHLEDMWKGVLAEDFVFSFRNSLEIKAYNSLESNFRELKWMFRCSISEWLQHDAENRVTRCENLNQLDMCYQQLCKELEKEVKCKANDFMVGFQKYFEDNKWQEIVIQWQERKLKALEYAVQDEHIEGKKRLLDAKEAIRMKLLRANKKGYEHEIMSKAIKLADHADLKNQEIGDGELLAKFEEVWATIAHELSLQDADGKMDIPRMIERELYEWFSNHHQTLRDALSTGVLYQSLRPSPLEGSIGVNFIEVGDLSLNHESNGPDMDESRLTVTADSAGVKTGTGFRAWASSTFSSMFHGRRRHVAVLDQQTRTEHQKRPPDLMQVKCKALVITNTILQDIAAHLLDLQSQDVMFQRQYIVKLLKRVQHSIDEFNKVAVEFTILPTYVVKLAVHICGHSVPIFTSTQNEYEENHGVASQLIAFRQTTLNLFRNTVKHSTEEKVVADLFCDKLLEIVKTEVTKRIPTPVVSDVLSEFAFLKYHLIVAIMEELAVRKDIRLYLGYIRDAGSFVSSWITHYTNRKLFNESGYWKHSRKPLHDILRCIVDSVEAATTHVSKCEVSRYQQWIAVFCANMGEEIAINGTDFECMAEREVVDFDNLKKKILDRMGEIEHTLDTFFRDQTSSTVKWTSPTPYQQIINELWGCPEQCQFCGEPCSDTTVGHYPPITHRCIQHRPAGVAGVRLVSTQEVDIDTCSFSVQSRAAYECSLVQYACRMSGKCNTKARKQTWHPYRKYKEHIPEWDIAPDPTNTSSKYWQWFMATFQDELVEQYRVKFSEVPDSWKAITEEEARESLRKYM